MKKASLLAAVLCACIMLTTPVAASSLVYPDLSPEYLAELKVFLNGDEVYHVETSEGSDVLRVYLVEDGKFLLAKNIGSMTLDEALSCAIREAAALAEAL